MCYKSNIPRDFFDGFGSDIISSGIFSLFVGGIMGAISSKWIGGYAICIPVVIWITIGYFLVKEHLGEEAERKKIENARLGDVCPCGSIWERVPSGDLVCKEQINRDCGISKHNRFAKLVRD